MRLIKLDAQKKDREEAARYWRGRGEREIDARGRERCFMYDCIYTSLARITELDIQGKILAQDN